MNWKQRLFRNVSLGFSTIGGVCGASFLYMILLQGEGAPIVKLNVPSWLSWTDGPIFILVLTVGAIVGFLVFWSPYWVITNFYEKVSENDQNEKATSNVSISKNKK